MTSVLKVNSITASSGTVDYQGLPTGNVIGVYTISHSTSTSISTVQSGPTSGKVIRFSGSFTKKYDHTSLIVEATVYGNGPYSGNAGTAFCLDYGVSGKESWHYGTSYRYDNQWQPYQIICVQGQAYFTNHHITGSQILAGTHTMGWGEWVKRSDQSTNRPFNTLSPNGSSSSDARNHQFVSMLVIKEIGR